MACGCGGVRPLLILTQDGKRVVDIAAAQLYVHECAGGHAVWAYTPAGEHTADQREQLTDPADLATSVQLLARLAALLGTLPFEVWSSPPQPPPPVQAYQPPMYAQAAPFDPRLAHPAPVAPPYQVDPRRYPYQR